MDSTYMGTLALALAAPGSAYLAALTAAAALPHRRAQTRVPVAPCALLRVALVVPAHNESLSLLRTLRSLQQAVRHETATATSTDAPNGKPSRTTRTPSTRIVVVADNCSDDTAQVALTAGVEVLERSDPQRRGKGCALQYAFDLIEEVDWFIVVDADTDVAPNFLSAMRKAMATDADTAALQCRYGVRDAQASPRMLLADVALGAWNILRPRGRSALGLSAGILGNGFALSRRALQAVPYTADSIVEDVEYHQLLVRAGLRVHWVDDTLVRGDMPTDAAAAGQQRARWEGGRLRLLGTQAPALAAAALRGQWRLLDPLFDLLLLPLAWHVSLLLLAWAAGTGFVQTGAALGLAVVALHVALALRLIGASPAHLRALLGVPVYLLWKLCLAGRIWRTAGRHAPWVRSARRPL